MDRASDSGSEGWGFESLPVYQTNKEDTHLGVLFICSVLRTGRDSKNQMGLFTATLITYQPGCLWFLLINPQQRLPHGEAGILLGRRQNAP